MSGELDTPGDEGIPGIWGAEMKKRNAEVAALGVGSIFGQQDVAVANSGRPENRPDPLGVSGPVVAASEELEVAGPLGSATQKGSGDFSGRPEIAKDVELPEKTPDPGQRDPDSKSSSPSEELLREKQVESSQADEQQDVTTKTQAEKVLMKSPAPKVDSKPLKPQSERLEYMRRPYTKPEKWPEPPPGKEWLQDPEYLYELGMAIHGYPIEPSLVITYSEPRRQAAARYAGRYETG
jgi:hypothetical protein